MKKQIFTCHLHDKEQMDSIKDISIESVGVADYCPVCKTSRRHAMQWEIEVDPESRREEHFDEPLGSQIGRTYVDLDVLPNTARLLAERERGEFGDWIDYD